MQPLLEVTACSASCVRSSTVKERLAALIAWFGWFVVGTVRSAVRTLRGAGSSIAAKILAVIALVALAAMLVLLWTDVQFVARWIRGRVA